jgi:Rrf2 family protein
MLSKKAKYALKALVYLATRDEQTPQQISDIANDAAIPKKFLETILLDLKKAGMLASKRGKGGGYYLIKHPKNINMAQVMGVMDGPIALLPCVSSRYYEKCKECQDESNCGIRHYLLDVRNKTHQILTRATLKKIIDKEYAIY